MDNKFPAALIILGAIGITYALWVLIGASLQIVAFGTVVPSLAVFELNVLIVLVLMLVTVAWSRSVIKRSMRHKAEE